MTKVQLLLLVVFAVLECALGGGDKNCYFKDIPETKYNDTVVYRVNSSINDLSEGIIQTFEIHNKIESLQELPIPENKYLNVTWKYKNYYMNISTLPDFANIAEDFPGESETITSISLSYYCKKSPRPKNLTIEQRVIFVKNRLEFDKAHYDLNFSLPIPKDFNLTSLQPILVQVPPTKSSFQLTLDPDMTDLLEVSVAQKTAEVYAVNLRALQDIPMPFQKEFRIIGQGIEGKPTVHLNVLPLDDCGLESADSKHPPVFAKQYYRGKYAGGKLEMEEQLSLSMGGVEKMITFTDFQYIKIIQSLQNVNLFTAELVKPFDADALKKDTLLVLVKVKNEVTGQFGHTFLAIDVEDHVHPPVFSKNVYFASYVNGTLNVTEPIAISHGWTDTTTLRQTGYEDFIKVSWSSKDKGRLEVELLKPFDNDTLKASSLEVAIQALNQGLSIPGKASLVVEISNRVISSSSCITVWNYTFNNAVFVFILFLVTMVILAMLNVVILGLYFRKRKMSEQAVVNVDAARF